MLFSARIDFRIIGGPINQLDIFFQDNKLEDVVKVARNQSDPSMFNKITVFFE